MMASKGKQAQFYMQACVRACVRARVKLVWPYDAVVCAVNFRSKHCVFDPHRVRFHMSLFSFSISGWSPAAKFVCLSMCGGKFKNLEIN